MRRQIEHLSTVTSDAPASERERVEVGAEAPSAEGLLVGHDSSDLARPAADA